MITVEPERDQILAALRNVNQGAYDGSPAGDWLLKKRLARHNPRTGWMDLTRTGRRLLATLEGRVSPAERGRL